MGALSEKGPGEVKYHLSQFLIGHGVNKAFLGKIRNLMSVVSSIQML